MYVVFFLSFAEMLFRRFAFSILTLWSFATLGQDSLSDLGFLPKAHTSNSFVEVNRWEGLYGQCIDVQFNRDSLGEIDFSQSLIVALFPDKYLQFIRFPVGGSETDVFIYPITKCTGSELEIDISRRVKEKIFMYGSEPGSRAIRIDDLESGLYYVQYASCHYACSWLLQLARSESSVPPFGSTRQ